MKKTFLAFMATSLTVSTLFALTQPNKQKLNEVITYMGELEYTCKETPRSFETSNSVLICQNKQKKIRLFQVEYVTVASKGRCGPTYSVENVKEI